MNTIETSMQTVPCRYCRQPIHPVATKCPYCHEQLTTRSRFEIASKKTIALIGIATALLSLFYGVKEGYFYIEQRQQQRQMFTAHIIAAENFIKLDNLEYAEASLDQALTLNPNDQNLRLRYFLLRSHNILRELDYYGAQLPDRYLTTMPELIISGFSLIENNFSADKQAHLLSSLARLLQFDQRWQNPAAINELFAKAWALTGNDAEIAYWYGERLINDETDKQKGLALIQKAMEIEPENAIYVAAMGRQQRKSGDYAAAFSSLRRAIELRPKQHELQRIRAANEAKYALRRSLRDADSIADISSEDFFSLNLQQRIDIVEFSLQHGSNDRYFNLVAAKLLHTAGQNQRSETLLRNVIRDYDERTDTEQLTLMANVLEAQNKPEFEEIHELLSRIAMRDSYEEIMETGIEGKHRYKVGLRVAKKNTANGIEVLKVFSGYPFAKAGVQAGDLLIEFGHRRVENLRSIWVPINDFSPGTDVPLKLQRGDKLIEVSVVIE